MQAWVREITERTWAMAAKEMGVRVDECSMTYIRCQLSIMAPDLAFSPSNFVLPGLSLSLCDAVSNAVVYWNIFALKSYVTVSFIIHHCTITYILLFKTFIETTRVNLMAL